ncbi:MAG: glycosyltransferase family 4 protein [Xanthobacteraceae bacterium]
MTPPHRPHILMTADTLGGVWTYATTLARELCRRGVSITLVTLGPPPGSDQRLAIADIPGLAVQATDLALEWMDPEGRDFSNALEQLRTIERRIRPDIVHLNGYREAAGDWNAPVLVAAHSCVRSWWVACREEEPCEERWLTYIDNVRSGLAAATAWVAPTAAFRDVVDRLYQPPVPGSVIWNAIDGGAPLRSKEPFILAAGRLWDEAKNIAILTRIAAQLPWPIKVAGRSRHPENARASAALQDITELGELSRAALREHMRRASIFAAPARYEPFGLTILEAARASCALVLADLPSLRELWDGAALFADPDDARAWRATLAHVARHDSMRHALQQRARQRARRYSIRAFADSYEQLYRSLAPLGWDRAAAPGRGQPLEVRP